MEQKLTQEIRESIKKNLSGETSSVLSEVLSDYEIRDKEKLITYAYIVNLQGQLIFIGKCVGYGEGVN